MDQSRRNFLKGVGTVAVGASLASVIPMAGLAEETAAHPFTYAKLDPDATADRGYASFKTMGGCCIGVADAILGQLADVVGAPYTGIPMDMFVNGAAGYGAGSLCGSLGGAAAAIGIVLPAADSKTVLAELFSWYRGEEFPVYEGGDVVHEVHTTSNSVNCLDSVGTFMSAAGITEMSDPLRIDRCACVTADVAKKTVELLNAHFGL